MATGKKDSKKASKLLKGGKSKDERSVAGSALSQSKKKRQERRARSSHSHDQGSHGCTSSAPVRTEKDA